MSNAYESLINEWLADPIVSKYYSSIPDLDYNTIDQNKFFNEPTSYLNWIGPTVDNSIPGVYSNIQNDYASAYDEGIQNSGLILPYKSFADINSVLRIPMLNSTKDSAPSLGKSYGWSTEILGNEASGFKTQEAPDSYINYLNDLVNYFPDTEFDVSGLLTNAGIGGLSVPTSWRGDVNIPLLDLPDNLDGYVRTKDYSYETANPYKFEGAKPITTSADRVADQVLMKGSALSELLPKFQDISNQLATGYDKNIELNDTPEKSNLGGVLGTLGTILSFTPLAPLGYAMQGMAAIENRNLLQGIGAAVGASGVLQGSGTIGDSFAAADAAQLAEQGLSNAAIAQNLGQAYNMGSVASNTLAGLTSVGITDPLYQSIATGGLTGGINAGLSGEDLGQGVLAGITGSAVGNAINSAPIGTSGNSTIDAGLSGLKGGLSNALTNTILGNDVNIGDTILAGAQKGLTKNLYGQALSAAKPAIKDFFSSWGSDDQMPSDEQLQELQFTNPDAYDWYMFGDEMGNLDQTDYSWMTNPNDTFNDPEFNDNTISQFLNSTNTVGTENVTTSPYVNLADSITSAQLPDTFNPMTSVDSGFTPPPGSLTNEQLNQLQFTDPYAYDRYVFGSDSNPVVPSDINAPIGNPNPIIPSNTNAPIDPNPTPWTDLPPSNVPLEPVDWGNIQDPSNLPWFDQSNTGNASVDDLINNVLFNANPDVGPISVGNGEQTGYTGTEQGDTNVNDFEWNQLADIFDMTNGGDPYSSSYDFGLGDVVGIGDLDWQQALDIFDLTGGDDPYNPDGFNFGDIITEGDSRGTGGNDLQSQQDADIFDLTEGGDPYNNGGFGSGSESSTSDSLTSSGVLKMIKDEVNKLMGGGAAGASNSALLYTLLQALMKSKQVGAGNQLSQDAVNMVVNSGEKGTPNRLNTNFGLPKTSVGVLPQMAAPTTNGIFDLGLTRK